MLVFSYLCVYYYKKAYRLYWTVIRDPLLLCCLWGAFVIALSLGSLYYCVVIGDPLLLCCRWGSFIIVFISKSWVISSTSCLCLKLRENDIYLITLCCICFHFIIVCTSCDLILFCIFVIIDLNFFSQIGKIACFCICEKRNVRMFPKLDTQFSLICI